MAYVLLNYEGKPVVVADDDIDNILRGPKGDKGDAADLAPAVDQVGGTSRTIAPSAIPSTVRVLLDRNFGFNFGSNPPSNVTGTVTLVVKQAASGGPYTFTAPSTLKWAGGAPAPIMPTVANSELVVHLFWTGLAWRAFNGGVFFP